MGHNTTATAVMAAMPACMAALNFCHVPDSHVHSACSFPPDTHKPSCVLQYADVSEEQREQWVKEQGAPSALSKIITTGFKAIHLIYFFTAGADEVKCWQIRKGSKAPQVHTLDNTA